MTAAVQVFIVADEVLVRAKECLLLVPGERAFGGHRLLEDGIALLFETDQDFLWERAGQAEADEICAAFFFEVRKRSTEMETTDEGIRLPA